jgi:hypothetical protein
MMLFAISSIAQVKTNNSNDGRNDGNSIGNSEPMKRLIITDEYYKNDIFTEWSKYLEDCNELVNDTIRQSGAVKYELVPVKMNGKVISYNTMPLDTVWNHCNCRKYKINDFSDYIFSPSASDGIYLSGSITSSTGFMYSEPTRATQILNITRDKICSIKKRKASFEDFFERWCVEKKLIKLN